MAREQDFITEARQAAQDIWNGINKLKSLQREWNALDYANTLDDGAGANVGIVRADVGAVVFATADALETALDSGHATNIAKLL